MGEAGVLFQASMRLATTANLRGIPSSGSDCSVVTGTVTPAASAFFREGSRKTAMPAPTGPSKLSTPRTPEAIFLTKLRRSGAGFFAQEHLQCSSMITGQGGQRPRLVG